MRGSRKNAHYELILELIVKSFAWYEIKRIKLQQKRLIMWNTLEFYKFNLEN